MAHWEKGRHSHDRSRISTEVLVFLFVFICCSCLQVVSNAPNKTEQEANDNLSEDPPLVLKRTIKRNKTRMYTVRLTSGSGIEDTKRVKKLAFVLEELDATADPDEETPEVKGVLFATVADKVASIREIYYDSDRSTYVTLLDAFLKEAEALELTSVSSISPLYDTEAIRDLADAGLLPQLFSPGISVESLHGQPALTWRAPATKVWRTAVKHRTPEEIGVRIIPLSEATDDQQQEIEFLWPVLCPRAPTLDAFQDHELSFIEAGLLRTLKDAAAASNLRLIELTVQPTEAAHLAAALSAGGNIIGSNTGAFRIALRSPGKGRRKPYSVLPYKIVKEEDENGANSTSSLTQPSSEEALAEQSRVGSLPSSTISSRLSRPGTEEEISQLTPDSVSHTVPEKRGTRQMVWVTGLAAVVTVSLLIVFFAAKRGSLVPTKAPYVHRRRFKVLPVIDDFENLEQPKPEAPMDAVVAEDLATQLQSTNP